MPASNAPDWSALYGAAGLQYNVDPNLMRALAMEESAEQPNAVGPNTRYGNARGMFQFIPQTAAHYGVTDPHDPTQAAYGAAHYLSDLLDQNNGNVSAALSTYGGWKPGDPAAAGYINKVQGNYATLVKSQQPPATPKAASPFDDMMSQKQPPAPAPTPPTPTSSPDAQSSPFDQLMTASPPATQPPVATPPVQPPAQPAPEQPTSDAPPIYRAPTTPLIRPPGDAPPSATFGMDPNATTMPSPSVGPSPTPGTTLTPAQAAMGPGLVHGARTAFNPLLESAAGAGSWIANKLTGSQPAWLPTGDQQRAIDAQNEAQFQQQYGGTDEASLAAQGAARAAQVATPIIAGGATSAALKAGLTAAGAPGVGAFLTGAGGQGAPGWAGFATRLASGGTSGAIQGGIAGGAPGAAGGAVLGTTLLPVAGKVADWVQARYGDAAVPAVQKIYQALVRDGMTPEAMDTAVQSLGVLGIPPDVAGANLKALSAAVANSPGPAAQTAAAFLDARAAGQTTRLNEAVRTATGATGSGYDTLEGLQAARASAAAPLYESSFNRIVPTAEEAARVQPFISDPIGQQALQQGMRVVQLENLAAKQPFNPADYGVTQGADGTFTLNPGTPNLRLMDAVKRGYDDIVEGFRDSTTGRLVLNQYGRAVNAARASYVGDLRDMYPRYANALDAWAGPSQAMDAVSMGRRVLTTDSDVTAGNVANMTPTMQEMYRVGVADALRTKIDQTPDSSNMVDATRRIFGNQDLRNKIAAGFGGADTPAFQNFQSTVERESAFADTQRQILGGSRTAPLSAAMADMNRPAPNLVEPALHLATGNPLAAGASLARQAVSPFVNMLTSPSERVNEQLGRLLFDPSSRQTLMNNLTPGQMADLRSRLTGWAGQQAAQALLGRNQLQSP